MAAEVEETEELAQSVDRPANIISTARNPTVSPDLQELSRSSPGVHIVTLNVDSQQSITSALQEVQSIVGNSGLNCLINNTAIDISSDIDTVTSEAMMKTFQTNCVGLLFVTKAFLPLLQTAAARSSGMGLHRAAVINMSSRLGSITYTWGDGAAFRSYAYRTSKASCNMLTQCLAADLLPAGILCVSLHPGWVQTDLGGPDAPLTVKDSVSCLIHVLSKLTSEDHGGFKDYCGNTLPW
ncbi:C-factor [Thalassophryne amazonica]|uniref:C-factor n=1 Tax=Thalassophryne amazonica TaxID=390379 RepID=UPI0014710982|nr:C-factor [Thalassophryne amazonica]